LKIQIEEVSRMIRLDLTFVSNLKLLNQRFSSLLTDSALEQQRILGIMTPDTKSDFKSSAFGVFDLINSELFTAHPRLCLPPRISNDTHADAAVFYESNFKIPSDTLLSNAAKLAFDFDLLLLSVFFLVFLIPVLSE
jgi:hypothetical protein